MQTRENEAYFVQRLGALDNAEQAVMELEVHLDTDIFKDHPFLQHSVDLYQFTFGAKLIVKWLREDLTGEKSCDIFPKSDS